MSKIIFPNKGVYTFLVFCFLSLQTLNAETLCSCDPVTDSLQLVQLRTATNGDDWTTPWDLNTPMSTWFGVVLNSEGCVSQLNLYQNFSAYLGNDLTGTLPNLELPELQNLVLQGNDISGGLPSFAGLPLLQELNLNANDITGMFPTFAENTDLRVLTMDGNSISGPVQNLPNSPQLRTLSCYFCELTGTLPDFSTNPALENIYLGRNEIEGEIPDFNLPQLRILNLNINLLTGDIFDFNGTPALEELLLGNNQLTGSIPDYQNLPVLRTLELAGNDISGTIPNFSGLPVLRNLQIGFNMLSGQIPNFSNLPSLKLLDISRAGVTGTMPDFSASPNLEKIGVIGNDLVGPVPNFSSFPLVTLRIQENKFEDLPDLSALSNWGDFVSNGFVANDNSLTFEDILPNMAAADSGFWRYAPQDSIGEERTEILVPNTNYTIDLGVDEGIADNVYNWFHNGVFIEQIVGSNELVLTNLQLTDQGIYTCQVTNVGAPDLTLYSRPVNLLLCTQATDATATNSGVYCTDDNIELFGNVNTSSVSEVSYQWEGPNGFDSNTLNPTDATEAGIYTFTAILDGCPSIPVSTEVEISQTPNQPIINPANITICQGESLQLNTETVNEIDYNWTGVNGFSSTNEDPTISANAQPNLSGTYFLTLNNNGCESPAASVEVSVLAVADADFSINNICAGETANPENITTNGGTFAFATAPNDGAIIDATTGEVSNTTLDENYSITYTLNSNSACPSQSTQSFSVVNAPQFIDITTNCAPNLLTYSIQVTTSDATTLTANFGTVNSLSADTWEVINIPANTDVILTANNNSATNCSIEQTVIAPACECPIITAPQTETTMIEICETDEMPTFLVTIAANYTANWYDAPTGGNLLAENTLTYTPSNAGVFYAETFDPLTQCISDNRTAIEFIISEISDIEIGTIECDAANDAYSVAFFSDGSDITLSEGTLTLLSENNYLVESVRDLSDLTITAINGACENRVIVPRPDCYCERIAEVLFTEPTCFGDKNGSILIERGSAYHSPVTIKIDGEIMQTNVELPAVISDLPSDIYNIEIEDQDGCLKSKTINLTEPVELILDFGGDQKITTGESIEIITFTNIVDIADFVWESDVTDLSCADCLNFTAKPSETTFYKLNLTNETGCSVTETLRIFVETDIHVFAPTAFSPDNDGRNDAFTLFGDEAKVSVIAELQIFDRWGNKLFANTDFVPNDLTEGWQGDFRGKKMKNDVYVWFAEIEYSNGKREILKGSVNLIR